MCRRGPGSHSYRPRIKWAQAHGAREAFDRRWAQLQFGRGVALRRLGEKLSRRATKRHHGRPWHCRTIRTWSLAIFKRSGSVGARDFRLNLAKNLVAGPGVLPNRLSNNPIVTSLVRDMFREPLYCALGTDGPQHRGISRDGCRHPHRCNRDAGRQSTSARFIAGLFGFFTLTQCRHRPPR